MSAKRRLTKRTRDRMEKETDYLLNTRFAMQRIEPMTRNQKNLFQQYEDGQNILAIGSAGTGKTYISLYLALKDVMDRSEYKEVIIVRSSVQSREQGHMPGNDKEKMSHFEAPYTDIVNDLFDRGDAYEIMKQKRMIRFMSTSFIRGLTFDNAIIIVDEVQNLTYGECRTILTRVGQSSKIILCGDTKQNDLIYSKNRSDISGLAKIIKVIDKMQGNSFGKIEFTTDDIIRSDFVKEFIIAEEILDMV
jgi:predicted ribonuclease YlaK